ncbi:hypothetical protein [Rhabdaerophilum sp. SD176]|uniref:hypothetical protein n=1 Tax=Rhabdaerophilum sp. SD176 TaxID=2983548 RepID=UPI0024E0117C|nr:hypothetical protein [Rhabdaerophilum sp. SD176]
MATHNTITAMPTTIMGIPMMMTSRGTSHKPHNPGDHSHESAVAAGLVTPMMGPVPRTILIVKTMDGINQTHFRLERPPRQA